MVDTQHEQAVDRISTALAWGGLAALLYLVYLILEPFLIPLGWAGVLAVVFYPAHARLALRWGPTRAAAMSTLAVTLILVVPIVLVTVAFAREALDAAGNLQQAFAEGRLGWIERLWRTLEQRMPVSMRLDVASIARDAATAGAAFLVAQSGFLLRNIAGFVLNLVLALFATFFLLRDSAAIMRVIRQLLPMDEASREATLARTREMISVGVVSAGVVAAVQGFLGGVIFAAVGIDAAVFWGVVMAICCLLPFGAWVIWGPAAIVLAAGGAVGRAIIVAALGFGVVSMADNVLRPMLLSGRAHLNGLVILLSLLGGIGVFGMLGIILGPVVLVTALGLLEGYVESKGVRNA
jgi:predicted PurR-regulated permease PerM